MQLWDVRTGRLLFLIDLDESLRCVAGNLEHRLGLYGESADLGALRRRLAGSETAR